MKKPFTMKVILTIIAGFLHWILSFFLENELAAGAIVYCCPNHKVRGIFISLHKWYREDLPLQDVVTSPKTSIH